MSSNLVISLTIGAALSGAWNTVFGNARNTLGRLGNTTQQLTQQQQRLGQIMARAMQHPTRNIGQLQRRYDQLGRTIADLQRHNDRLNLGLARGDALRQQRADLRGRATETIGNAAVVGVPIFSAVKQAGDFEELLRDIKITAGFDKKDEFNLGKNIRQAALDWNQTTSEIAKGLQVLSSGSIQTEKELSFYAPLMAKASVATGASMEDLGRTALALNDNLGITASGFERGLNMIADAGKRGLFEIPDMAKWLPNFTAVYGTNFKIKGEAAISEIGAMLQTARIGSSSSDEAANNFKAFLSKLTSGDTVKAFSDNNIDIIKSYENLTKEGISRPMAMLRVLEDHLGKKNPKVLPKLGEIAKIEDAELRKEQLEALGKSVGLQSLFADQEVMQFLVPVLGNMHKLRDDMAGIATSGGNKVIDKDWQDRVTTFNAQMTKLGITLSDMGLSLGVALLPPIVELGEALMPIIKSFAELAKAHPEVIKGFVGLITGLVVGKLAFLGLRYSLNLIIAPFNAIGTTIAVVRAELALFRIGALATGRLAPLINGLKQVGSAFKYVGNSFVSVFRGIGSGVATLGRLLGSGLITSVRVAGTALRTLGVAVQFVGRAMLMTPLGRAIGLLTLLGIVVYTNRQQIIGWITDLITWGVELYNGAVGWTSRAIEYLAGLPDKFMQWGGNIVDGLINGIKNKFTEAKDTIIEFGQNIKGWFTDTLGIQSPSRIFMGFGDNIVQGAALGIHRTSSQAEEAAQTMARRVADTAQSNNILANLTLNAGANGIRGGGYTITFSPVIHITAAASGINEQVQQGLNIAQRDFERMLDRVLADRQRRAF